MARMRQTRGFLQRGAARGLLVMAVMLSTMARASDVLDAPPAPAPAPALNTPLKVVNGEVGNGEKVVPSKRQSGRKPMFTIRSTDLPIVLNATWAAEAEYDEFDNATAIPLETIMAAKELHKTIPAGMEESIAAFWSLHAPSGAPLLQPNCTPHSQCVLPRCV